MARVSVSVGLLQAALDAQQAALAVVAADGQVIAASTPARRLLDALAAPAESATELLPAALARFAAMVASEVSARELEAQLMSFSGRAIRVRGTPHSEGSSAGAVHVLLCLEEVLRPWDMVVDAKVILHR